MHLERFFILLYECIVNLPFEEENLKETGVQIDEISQFGEADKKFLVSFLGRGIVYRERKGFE